MASLSPEQPPQRRVGEGDAALPIDEHDAVGGVRQDELEALALDSVVATSSSSLACSRAFYDATAAKVASVFTSSHSRSLKTRRWLLSISSQAANHLR